MAAKPKQAGATETHQSIARQTAEFLKNGNKIEVIPSGKSGQPITGMSKKAT